MLDNIRKYRKPICGVGTNDATYETSSGGKIVCPCYKQWHNMLNRCYGKAYLKKPHYGKATVCDEWLVFTNFKKWMMTQNWEGKNLDKDLRSWPNRVYSPETCAFISKRANSVLVGIDPIRYYKGKPCKYLRGVQEPDADGLFSCFLHPNKLKGFKTELDAHNHYRNIKADHILDNIDLFDDNLHKYVKDLCERYRQPITL